MSIAFGLQGSAQRPTKPGRPRSAIFDLDHSAGLVRSFNFWGWPKKSAAQQSSKKPKPPNVEGFGGMPRTTLTICGQSSTSFARRSIEWRLNGLSWAAEAVSVLFP